MGLGRGEGGDCLRMEMEMETRVVGGSALSFRGDHSRGSCRRLQC